MIYNKIIAVCCCCFIAANIASCSSNKEYDQGISNTGGYTETKEKIKNGEKLFSTEYDIEDYCDGRFIVSKSDGLLHGVLDMEGNEVIPIKYDSVEFMNKNAVMSGTQENLYIKTGYEREYNVYNIFGELVLAENVHCIEYEIGDTYENSPFFIECNSSAGNVYTSDCLKIYSEDGALLNTFSKENNSDESYTLYSYQQISKNCYLISESPVKTGSAAGSLNAIIDYSSTKLYDKSNNVIKEWIGLGGISLGIVSENNYIFTLIGKDNSMCNTINETGDIIDEQSFDKNGATNYISKLSLDISRNGNKNLLKSDTARLYESNGTFKLENNEGTALYDERYYRAMEIYEAPNNCHLLFNENNDCCLVDRNGILRIDYGIIEMQNDENIFINGQPTNNKIYEGTDSVCFAVKNNSLWDIYYFNGK